jgi:hypothetical protein
MFSTSTSKYFLSGIIEKYIFCVYFLIGQSPENKSKPKHVGTNFSENFINFLEIFISPFKTQTMHIKSSYTQQHCYVSLKILYPGGIRTWVFLLLRWMRCPLRQVNFIKFFIEVARFFTFVCINYPPKVSPFLSPIPSTKSSADFSPMYVHENKCLCMQQEQAFALRLIMECKIVNGWQKRA